MYSPPASAVDPFNTEVIMRYCKYCNTPQEEGDLFCVGCGRSIASDQSQDQSRKMTARKKKEQGSLDPFFDPRAGEMPGAARNRNMNNYSGFDGGESGDDATTYAWQGNNTYAGGPDQGTYGAWTEPGVPGGGGAYSNTPNSNTPNNPYDNYYGTSVEFQNERDDKGNNRWLIPVIIAAAAAVLLLVAGAVFLISGRSKAKDSGGRETVAAETGENDTEENGTVTGQEDGVEPASDSGGDTDGTYDEEDTLQEQETVAEEAIVQEQEAVTEAEEETARHMTVIPEKKEEDTAATADTGFDDLMIEEEEEEEEEEDSVSWFLSDSSNRYYSRSELEKLDDYSLQMAINEIYARHGRKFDTPSIREYFEDQPWYHGTISPADFDGKESKYFNEYETANRELMAQIRDERAAKKPAGR